MLELHNKLNEEVALWEVLVPTIMNKKHVRTRHHKQWDKFVRSISGGLTVLKPAKGQWLEPTSKELYEERTIPVRIACTRKQIDKIIDFTIKHYNQLAVMAYKLSNEVIIKNRE